MRMDEAKKLQIANKVANEVLKLEHIYAGGKLIREAIFKTIDECTAYYEGNNHAKV